MAPIPGVFMGMGQGPTQCHPVKRSVSSSLPASITGQGSDALHRVALPAEKIVNGTNVSARRADPSIGATFAGPMVDGQIVVESSERHVSGTQANIPLMIGTNSSDLAYPQEKTMAELFSPLLGTGTGQENCTTRITRIMHEVGL